MCYNPALVRTKPPGAPASVKLIYCIYEATSDSVLTNVRLLFFHTSSDYIPKHPPRFIDVFFQYKNHFK